MQEKLTPTELNNLLARLVCGDLEGEALKTLQEAMRSDKEAFDHSFDFILTAAALDHVSHEATGLEQHQETVETLTETTQVSSHIKLLPKLLALAALVLITLAIVFPWAMRGLRPSGPTVATLTHSMDIRWADRGSPTQAGSSLVEGPMELITGAAQIQLQSGTELILRAPCRFTLTPENQVLLEEGMLGATVPPQAIGFTVIAKNVRVVDQGTQFGMIVDPEGRVETHVFSGQVDIHSMFTPEEGGQSLYEGMALTTNSAGVEIAKSVADEPRFFLTLPPRHGQASPGRYLSLADMVGGGNGFGSGTLNQGIDPVLGTVVTEPSSRSLWDHRAQFCPLEDWTYIDGVFVPNGERGKAIITSTGLHFDRCPYTDSCYYEGIFNGAQLSEGGDRGSAHQGSLKGIRYGTLQHPAINMHPNCGITFDLEAIRRDHPGLSVTRMKSLCGISETAPLPRLSEVEFWVLLDGEVRYRFLCPPQYQEQDKIDLPLPTDTRFLTLVTTCSGEGGHNWAFFGDPVLELRRSTP